MLRYMKLFMIGLVLFFSWGSLADNAMSKKQLVAVIDISQGVLLTEKGKELVAIFEKDPIYKERIDAFKKLTEEREKLIEEFQKNQSIWDEPTIVQKRRVIVSLEEDIQHDAKKIQLQNKEFRAFIDREFKDDIPNILTDLTKELGIDILLRKELVIYANADFDITEMMVDKLNALYAERDAAASRSK